MLVKIYTFDPVANTCEWKRNDTMTYMKMMFLNIYISHKLRTQNNVDTRQRHVCWCSSIFSCVYAEHLDYYYYQCDLKCKCQKKNKKKKIALHIIWGENSLCNSRGKVVLKDLWHVFDSLSFKQFSVVKINTTWHFILHSQLH